jgi:hypothetical protein
MYIPTSAISRPTQQVLHEQGPWPWPKVMPTGQVYYRDNSRNERIASLRFASQRRSICARSPKGNSSRTSSYCAGPNSYGKGKRVNPRVSGSQNLSMFCGCVGRCARMLAALLVPVIVPRDCCLFLCSGDKVAPALWGPIMRGCASIDLLAGADTMGMALVVAIETL